MGDGQTPYIWGTGSGMNGIDQSIYYFWLIDQVCIALNESASVPSKISSLHYGLDQIDHFEIGKFWRRIKYLQLYMDLHIFHYYPLFY